MFPRPVGQIVSHTSNRRHLKVAPVSTLDLASDIDLLLNTAPHFYLFIQSYLFRLHC